MQPDDPKERRLKRNGGRLKRGAALKRGKPIRRTPFKPKRSDYAAQNPDWIVVKKEVRERSGGRCEAQTPVCTGRGQHVHHVILRGQGGPDQPWNLLDVCERCHRFIHDNPAESYERGWLRRALTTETG